MIYLDILACPEGVHPVIDSCPTETRTIGDDAPMPALGQVMVISNEFHGFVRGAVYRVTKPNEKRRVTVLIDPRKR